MKSIEQGDAKFFVPDELSESHCVEALAMSMMASLESVLLDDSGMVVRLRISGGPEAGASADSVYMEFTRRWALQIYEKKIAEWSRTDVDISEAHTASELLNLYLQQMLIESTLAFLEYENAGFPLVPEPQKEVAK